MKFKTSRVQKSGFRLPALMLVLIGLIITSALSAAEDKNTYVLVHGAWVGEWYWEPVSERLENQGHEVYAISLTGHGGKAELGGKDVDSSDHIDDIVSVIIERGLENVILVAHSYGGRPATGAWDLARKAIDHVVYVEAVAPLIEEGIVIPSDSRSLSYLMLFQPDIVDSGMFPVPLTVAKSLQSRSTPHSIKSLYAEVELKNGPLPADTKRTYVVGKNVTKGLFRAYADRLKDNHRWNVVELDIEHNFYDAGAEALAEFLAAIE